MSSSQVQVVEAAFDDVPNIPEVHADDRRTIREIILPFGDGDGIVRVTRIRVASNHLPLGNHYHTFAESFSGHGGGTLYVADADGTGKVSHELPDEGWQVRIPKGVVHAFVLNVGAILISTAPATFQDGVNTQRVTIC